jgi:hypothetical protein
VHPKLAEHLYSGSQRLSGADKISGQKDQEPSYPAQLLRRSFRVRPAAQGPACLDAFDVTFDST